MRGNAMIEIRLHRQAVIRLMLALLLAIAMISPLLAQPMAAHAAEVYVDENFDAHDEGAPSGWSASKNLSDKLKLEAVQVNGKTGKSLRFYSEERAGGDLSLTYTFKPPISGKIVFEAQVMLNRTDIYTPIFSLKAGDDKQTGLVIFGNDGKIKAGETVVQPYEAGTWYHVAATLDTASKKFDFYLNGTKLVTGETLKSETTSNELKSFKAYTKTGEKFELYLDDVKVYEGEKPAAAKEEADPKPPASETSAGNAGPKEAAPGKNNPPLTYSPFADIRDHWAKEDIEQLGSKLVVLGIAEGTFAPDQAITRAEFTAYLVRGLGLKEEAVANQFLDVTADDWYAGSIAAAVKAGLIQGTGEKAFAPADPITREQMATILSRALRLTQTAPTVSSQQTTELLAGFADQGKISDWARHDVAIAVQAKIIQGMTEDSFVPQEKATRAQATVMLKRFLDHIGFLG